MHLSSMSSPFGTFGFGFHLGWRAAKRNRVSTHYLESVCVGGCVCVCVCVEGVFK